MAFDEGREIAAFDLKTDRDVVRARSRVGEIMKSLGSSDLMQTRFVTAVSEVARNAMNHAGGGRLTVYSMADGRKIGIKCTDAGAGIDDIDAAMVDGFTTRKGSMGRGLGGAKRLAHEFMIESAPGKGTTVRMIGICKLR